MEEKQECKYSDLIVTPERLDFENEEGSRFVPPMQDLFIKKAGGEGVLDAGWSLHITSQGSFWLNANPMSGRGTGRCRVSIKSGELAEGAWEGQIEVKIEETLRDKVSVTPSVIPVMLVVEGKEEEEPPPPPPPPAFVCPHCGDKFDTEGELQQHIEDEHSHPPTLRRLSISSMGRGMVTTPGQDTFTYYDGTVVDLVAEAEEGARFVNWIGERSTIADVHAAVTTITMLGDYTIIANFEEAPPPPPPEEPGCWLWRLLKKLGYFLVKVYPRERAK